MARYSASVTNALHSHRLERDGGSAAMVTLRDVPGGRADTEPVGERIDTGGGGPAPAARGDMTVGRGVR
jgi:hypothetical protein